MIEFCMDVFGPASRRSRETCCHPIWIDIHCKRKDVRTLLLQSCCCFLATADAMASIFLAISGQGSSASRGDSGGSPPLAQGGRDLHEGSYRWALNDMDMPSILHDRPLILDHTHTPRTLDTMSIVRQHSMAVQPRQRDTDGHDPNPQLIELPSNAATQRPHSIVLPVSTENGL